MAIPRGEHPKPQFARAEWMNLNGEWQFEFDNGKSGKARKLYEPDCALSATIRVPFCPESTLSGIHHIDFLYGVWYKRQVFLPEQQLKGRVVLHFGAVDYACTAYVNGQEVGRHQGGYASFSFDITRYVVPGDNQIAVFAADDTRDPLIPRGKQSEEYGSHGCDYTRTTGIWQTVWLEFTPLVYIDRVRYYPDSEHARVTVQAQLKGAATLSIRAYYEGRLVGEETVDSRGGCETVELSLSETHVWEIGRGRLYDLELTYGSDRVRSYVGLRTIHLEDGRFLLNGQPVFQRLVLDQGFYPDGIYTAPTDDALVQDIRLSQAMGFNGARLHQKVFEERFLYHCDRLGYMVWGEYPNWGLDHSRAESVYALLPEWMRVVERDFNHPALIGWCPYNETWDRDGRKQWDAAIRLVYAVTKAMDPTRPCIDTSGCYHVETDIYDVHDYEQDPATFREHYARLLTDGVLHDTFDSRQQYRGEPVFVSEFGGIRWSRKGGWGYGNAPHTEAEFLSRFQGLIDALLDNPRMMGFCYTQLTDVEQEQNGLYTYEREAKFDPALIRSILSRPAAMESGE